MRLANWWERVQNSLFYVPLLFGIGGALLAEAALAADAGIEGLPDRVTATVDSARSVLSVIAGATLTFAAIAFSVSLLLISAASSQFSPRVVHGLFRDPFNKRVMGAVVGTFIYCLVVMRAVRGPLEEAGTPVVPSLSVLIAVVLGMAAILSIVAFINHSAHTMEVSNMLHKVTETALAQAQAVAPEAWQSDAEPPAPSGQELTVDFDAQGWVQSIDYERILGAIPPETAVRLETTAGRYAIRGTALCRLWPRPTDEETLKRTVRRAVVVAPSRSMQQDASFGVRQLADVALKALSPGINDPTTAQDALFHMASVVRELLALPHHGRIRHGDDGRVLLIPEAVTPRELVGLAFDEVRLASHGQPTVLIYLLEILRLLIDALDAEAHPDAIDSLRMQADLVVAAADFGELPEWDRERIRSSYAKRFAAA